MSLEDRPIRPSPLTLTVRAKHTTLQDPVEKVDWWEVPLTAPLSLHELSLGVVTKSSPGFGLSLTHVTEK